MSKPKVIAFCTAPHTGGIYNVYQRLRDSLKPEGWDVRCVYCASEKRDWYGYHASLVDDGCVEIGDTGDDLLTAARQFVRWVEENEIAIVIPSTSRVAVSALPHLPSPVKVVTRCTNVTPHAYRIVAAHSKRSAATVVTSIRQQADLPRNYGMDPEKLRLIPNAVDTSKFSVPRQGDADGLIRLGFIDRIDATHKHIMALPKIVSKLERANIPWQLGIVGAGPDEERLKAALAQYIASDQVQFFGACPIGDIPQRLANFDILIKATPFEGFPSSLIEAMCAGAVPVCSRIAGVTDWIITNGVDGCLVPIGDSDRMAEEIISLSHNRDALEQMRKNARRTVEERFSLTEFGRGWNDLLTSVLHKAVDWPAPRPWSEFRLARPWNRPWKERVIGRSVPRWLKKWIRNRSEKKYARWAK